MEDTQAILLTGGASRRMGTDKSQIEIDGIPMAERIAQTLTKAGIPVTIAGRHPLPNYNFQKDKEDFQGPLATLAQFTPTKPYIFIASCDLPNFQAEIVEKLREEIEDHEAAIPIAQGKPQPLCALYQAPAWPILKTIESKRVMDWLAQLKVKEVHTLDPNLLRNANTPADLLE